MQACVSRGCVAHPMPTAICRPVPGEAPRTGAASALSGNPELRCGPVVDGGLDQPLRDGRQRRKRRGRPVVTAPTNGAAGIIPAVLHYYVRFMPGANDKACSTFC